MKTSYNILWIDDDPKSVDTDQEDVKEYLEEFGIRADINFVEAPPDGSIKSRLEHDLKDPELDILLVDYHMDGLKGDQLVRLIRETDHIYLPVIFYSSSSVEDLLDAVRASELDGVYIANRTALMNKVRNVVGSLLVREQTVKQVRGLLMEGVSEIDARFYEILKKAWVTLDESGQAAVAIYLQEILDKRAKSVALSAGNLPSDNESFGKHLDENFLTRQYDTYTRWRLTMKILELAGDPNDGVAQLKKFASQPVGDAEKSLNALRNDYAHKTRRALAEGHTDARCVQIRKAIRYQTVTIDSILGGE